MTKFYREDIYEIKKLLAEATPVKSIASRYDVSESIIYNIRNLKSHVNIAPEYNDKLCDPNLYRKLSPEEIYEIKKLLSEGIRGVEIAKRFNITSSYTSRIKKLEAHVNDAPEFNDSLRVLHPFRKMNEDLVREIRRSHPERSYRDLAANYGVSSQTIYLIVKRLIWKDVI